MKARVLPSICGIKLRPSRNYGFSDKVWEERSAGQFRQQTSMRACLDLSLKTNKSVCKEYVMWARLLLEICVTYIERRGSGIKVVYNQNTTVASKKETQKLHFRDPPPVQSAKNSQCNSDSR